MKSIKSGLLILALFLSVSGAFAQDDQLDNLKFEGSEAEEIKPPYFAIAGGVLGNFFFVDFKELNDHIKTKGFDLPELKSPMFIYGGEGFTALPFIPNLRVGFVGMGGKTSTEKDSADLNKGVEYSVGYTGFAFDYGVILFSHFAFVPGVTFGWGNVTIESWSNSGVKDWNNVITPATDRTKDYIDRAEASFLFLQLNLNFEYAVAPYLMFRVNPSFTQTLVSDKAWLYNRGSDIGQVPKRINGSGFNLQLGVFVGLFNY